MRVVRGREVRTLEFFLWANGTDKAVVKVLSPAKERATASLRLGTEFWAYSPTIERVQKLSPSTMNLAWMGGDFSNGDLVRGSSLSRYYDHRITGQENRGGTEVYVVESVPRRNSPVPPGKILSWLARDDSRQVRQELFDAAGKLERTVVGKAFRRVGDRHFASTLVVTKAGTSDGFTQIDYSAIRFDRPLADIVFSQEFLRKRLETPELPSLRAE